MSGAALLLAMGGAPGIINAISYGANDNQLSPSNAFASVFFENDGDVLQSTSDGPSDAGDWITPKLLAPNLYEIMAHQDSGSALDGASSALDTWLALTTNRGWQITQVGSGSKSASLTVSIRFASGPTLRSGTVSLSATTF